MLLFRVQNTLDISLKQVLFFEGLVLYEESIEVSHEGLTLEPLLPLISNNALRIKDCKVFE